MRDPCNTCYFPTPDIADIDRETKVNRDTWDWTALSQTRVSFMIDDCNILHFPYLMSDLNINQEHSIIP